VALFFREDAPTQLGWWYGKKRELLLPVNSDSTECVDEDTGGEVAPSHVVVDPASDGVVLLAPCKAKQNKNTKNISEISIKIERESENFCNGYNQKFKCSSAFVRALENIYGKRGGGSATNLGSASHFPAKVFHAEQYYKM
jgi:hypothetical protein